jgi:transcription initiation factor TFIID subunit 5
MEMVIENFYSDSKVYLEKFKGLFERIHADEIRVLETITLSNHVLENSLCSLYRNNKYRIPLNTSVYFTLHTHLESNAKIGGSVILKLLSERCEIRETSRGPIDQYSFEAIINRARGKGVEDDVYLEEGIPGAFTGVTNKDILNNNIALHLGPLTMEPELAQDVRAELEEEDARDPPEAGQQSLVELFDQKIKREESADGPNRNEIAYPPSRARDVIMEVQKIKENRDRFKIDSRTGGVGPGVSVCMFTFHNTLDR